MTAGIAGCTVGGLLDAIAARQPTPGGGAVAALTTGLAAALGGMVAGYGAGLDETGEALARLRAEALRLADEDAEAFEALSALWKLPRDDRRAAPGWTAAVAGAIDAPRRTAALALQILETLAAARAAAGRSLRSDLAIAALLARAGGEAAARNVRINLPQLDDREEAGRMEAELRRELARAAELQEEIDRACR